MTIWAFDTNFNYRNRTKMEFGEAPPIPRKPRPHHSGPTQPTINAAAPSPAHTPKAPPAERPPHRKSNAAGGRRLPAAHAPFPKHGGRDPRADRGSPPGPAPPGPRSPACGAATSSPSPPAAASAEPPQVQRSAAWAMPLLRPASAHEPPTKTDGPFFTLHAFCSLRQRWDSSCDLPLQRLA
ncbi:uncharacterized protein LOC126016405 [Suncus etruscus]|uniref:uncharacterized protein LOC126016405 n=1 Tax=Suncus etruscus TaxID=109475 RepID=UPI00211046EA|nr:uncharacterized protein LOC126016405 [Suncus etruscus]